MKDLGIDVELYISSEVDPDAIKVCVHNLEKYNTVEPLYRGHHWDPAGCPVYSGVSL